MICRNILVYDRTFALKSWKRNVRSLNERRMLYETEFLKEEEHVGKRIAIPGQGNDYFGKLIEAGALSIKRDDARRRSTEKENGKFFNGCWMEWHRHGCDCITGL